jgi:carbon monoxide dehydrogenase subunit G
MLIEGKFTVNVPIEKVWGLLLDPKTLASCVPGCEKLEVIDEKTYESVIKQNVGPIKVRFKFITTLTELDPPIHLKAIGKGGDMGKAGTFNQETTVDLKEISPGEVEVTYKSDVSIVGKLATFGDRIMRAKAKQVEREFTQALNKRLFQEQETLGERPNKVYKV